MLMGWQPKRGALVAQEVGVVDAAHDVAAAEAVLVARKLVEPHVAQRHRWQAVVAHQQPGLCRGTNGEA